MRAFPSFTRLPSICGVRSYNKRSPKLLRGTAGKECADAQYEGTVTAALLVVAAALLLVGVVSQTVVRRAIQLAPGVLLLASRPGRRVWVSYAATAVFAFWLFIMSLIWLYLLDLAKIVLGVRVLSHVRPSILLHPYERCPRMALPTRKN